jgi:DNA replication protein DnaC
MTKNDIRIETQKNTCCQCGKEFEQPLLISQFGIIIGKYCDECYDKAERKEKAIQKQIEERNKAEWLERIGVKKDYIKATLDNYKAETPSQSEALTCAKMLRDGDIKKLILLGGNGVGKTHLASALVKLMNGKIITAYEMYAYYRSCFSGQNNELDLLKKFKTYPLLVIDEFGRTKGSEAEDNFLSVIVDSRHSDGLPTMILSNLIRKRDCVFFMADKTSCEKRKCKNCLESWLTADLISRLREESKVVYIEGEDYRSRKHD